MEAHTRHHRLVAVDECFAVVEAPLRFVGLRNNPDCYQYSRSILDLGASMGERQLEAEAGSHHSTAGACDLEEMVHQANQCHDKGYTRRDDDGAR